MIKDEIMKRFLKDTNHNDFRKCFQLLSQLHSFKRKPVEQGALWPRNTPGLNHPID